MKVFRHIFPVIIAIVLFSSCSNGERKLISRGDFAEIYAEMLLTDQWVFTHPSNRRTADTSLVYEPILNKYGYTTEDYLYSVDKYMDDPERYSRILRTTGEILDEKLKELEIKREELQRLEDRRKYIEKIMAKARADLRYTTIYQDTTNIHYRLMPDSVAVELDSFHIFHLILKFDCDSIIDGPRLVSLDTLARTDTLSVADTLK